MPIAPRSLAALVALLMLVPPQVLAQSPASGSNPGQDQPAAEPTSPTLGELFAQIERAEPIRRAGLRADLIRRAQQVVPAVVLVTDARSYLAAVGAWEGQRRFPVLWDDGTLHAREDIARFVRAFEPERVLRFKAGDDAPAWPRARADREARFLQTLAQASDQRVPDYDAYLRALRQGGLVSPGIVLTDVDDNAWPAALALAAARVQPAGFVANPSNLTRPLTPDQADLLEEAAQRTALATGLGWQGIGDAIDAVTLCLNTGTRVRTGEEARDWLSTTDRVGRLGRNGEGRRWANTGQIFGSSAQATYRAMCALFLTPRDAFIFDGYDESEPWVTYSGRSASQALTEFGMDTQLHNRPGNTSAHWTAMTARPLRAGIILINSHGTQAVLNFPGGAVRGSNTPLLQQPAIAHVVHSFSLQSPANRNTVGGSLLDRGVYAMLGSVDEPFLQAFVPTPLVARRLAAGMNFAAAVRIDDAPVWKLTVMGDPLITLGPAGNRLEDQSPDLPGTTTDLDDELRAALGDKDLAAAAEILTLLGRDADAARLAVAVIDDKQATLTADLAAAAIPALFRNSRHEHVVNAYANLTDEQRAEPVLADCFWFAGRFLLGSSPDRERAERLMRVYPRPGSRVFDAEELAMHVRPRSIEEAILVLESVRPGITQDWEFRALESALERVRTGSR